MNYALIFAGGVGNRMNSKAKPKQFLEIHGKPILIHTLEHFEAHPAIDAVCLVVVADWIEYAEKLIERYGLRKVRWIAPGGTTAMESQANGLNSIQRDPAYDPNGIVLIHDGVRPLIDGQLIGDCITSVKEYGSAITVAPATETIIRADGNGKIEETIPRSACMLARAPQAFYMRDILAAHRRAKEEQGSFIDSASMMLHYGFPLHAVEGPAENIKVTSPADFYICRALLDARENSQIYGL